MSSGSGGATASFLGFLEGRSRPFIVVAGVALVLLLGFVDYVTGFEISFAVFYLIPVALVAWFGQKSGAVLISVLSAVAWQAANQLAGEVFSHPLIPVWNASTRMAFFLIVAALLAKLKQSLLHERELARTDFLTGAANPRAFYEIAQMEIDRARRYRRPFTIAYFDADNFKSVNDQLGHHTGSQLLVRVVEVMKQNLRASDLVARMGGDEFVVLLPETGVAQAQPVLRKLRTKLGEAMQSAGWPVSFSVGLLTCVDAPRSVDEMIRTADGLMYEVKQGGRDAISHKVLRAQLVTEPAPERAG